MVRLRRDRRYSNIKIPASHFADLIAVAEASNRRPKSWRLSVHVVQMLRSQGAFKEGEGTLCGLPVVVDKTEKGILIVLKVAR